MSFLTLEKRSEEARVTMEKDVPKAQEVKRRGLSLRGNGVNIPSCV